MAAAKIVALVLFFISVAVAQKKFTLVGSFGEYPVETFTLDYETGGLTSVNNTFAGPGPDFFAFTEDYSRVFMTGEQPSGSGSATSWSINPTTAELTLISNVTLDTPTHISLHPSERWVFTASYFAGTVSVLSVGINGELKFVSKTHIGNNAHMTLVDPSGRYVLAACLGSDYVAQLVFNQATGELESNQPAYAKLPNGTGPRHLAFHPNHRVVYLVNELNSSVVTWDYNAQLGTLSNPVFTTTLPPTWKKGQSFQAAAELHITRDAKFLYVSNRSPDFNTTGYNGITIYNVADNGALTAFAWEDGAGDINYPRYFALDPTEKFVLVCNQLGESVTNFNRLEDGTLTKIGKFEATNLTAFVAVLPF